MIDVEMRWDQEYNDEATPHPLHCYDSSGLVSRGLLSASVFVAEEDNPQPTKLSTEGRPLLGYQHHSPGRLRQWQQRKTLIVIKQQQAVLDLCPWKTVVVMLVTSPCRNSFEMDSKNNTICGSRKKEKNTRHRPQISRCTVFVFNHQFGMPLSSWQW